MSYMTAAAWIGAALVAAGTAANAYGTSKANRQANSVLLDALKQSKENGDDVTKKIMEALPEYETDNRLKQQEALSDQTKQAISQPVENVQLNTATKGGTQGDVSSDYTTARARANAQTLEDVRNLAQMMGAVTSAQRLRQNEGFRLADLQNEINLMNSFNNGNQRVAQLRAQAKAETRRPNCKRTRLGNFYGSRPSGLSPERGGRGHGNRSKRNIRRLKDHARDV